MAVTRVRGLTGPDRGYREAPRALEEPSREEVARVLAELTGRDEADWRMRIGQPLPWLIATEPDAARASTLVAELRRRGLGAVSCHSDAARPWAPRGHATLVLHETELGFVEDPRRIAYDAIRVVVLAMLDTETSTEEIERVTVSVNARTQPQSMPVTRYRREQSRRRAIFLVLGAEEPDIRLVQGSVHLTSSAAGPAAIGSTSFERFDRAAAALLARIPSAIRDERLLTARRAPRGFSSSTDGATHTTSNTRETDLVAHVIGLAWAEGQIDPPAR